MYVAVKILAYFADSCFLVFFVLILRKIQIIPLMNFFYYVSFLFVLFNTFVQYILIYINFYILIYFTGDCVT